MEEAYIHYLAPALVAGVFGVVSALVTSRLSGGWRRRWRQTGRFMHGYSKVFHSSGGPKF
jgi:hypothetical protein